MVLTHLILNDMVKVKGQISELATCIVDDDTRISGLSRLFFHELAKKVMRQMTDRQTDRQTYRLRGSERGDREGGRKAGIE